MAISSKICEIVKIVIPLHFNNIRNYSQHKTEIVKGMLNKREFRSITHTGGPVYLIISLNYNFDHV